MSSVAKRYARAFFKLASDQDRLSDYGADLSAFSQLLREHAALKESLESPVLSVSAKKSILKALQSKLGFGEALLNLLQVMVDHDRLSELTLLALDFAQMADEALGQLRVKVQSVSDLGEHAARLSGALEKALGKKVILDTVVDAEILGGLKVQVGDQVFDGSLKKELESLKTKILEVSC